MFSCFFPFTSGEFLFEKATANGTLSDTAVGVILLIIALFLLCVCLVLIVKTLHSLLRGQIAHVIRTFINADFPGKVCGYFTGYLAIAIGAVLTVLVQSSSIFTSSITPLVGIGVLTIDRMYPLTLGSNIGTTATGILAAFAQDSSSIHDSMQIALCHLLFNIFGIILYYPIPFMRIPIKAAKFLGTETAKYRWFAVVYLIVAFFIIPAVVFGLSLLSWIALAAVFIPIALMVLIITVIKVLQNKKPEVLHAKLQDWKWLPAPLRSLEPYDRFFMRITGNCAPCRRFGCCKAISEDQRDKYEESVEVVVKNENGHSNGGYDNMANGIKTTDVYYVRDGHTKL